MPITKEQVGNYLNNGGSRCPVCESYDIEAGRIEADGNIAWGNVTCGVCGFKWQDQYKLINIESI